MRPVLGLALAVLAAFMGPSSAYGQKVYRIGGLAAEDQFVPAMQGFKKRMAELGYEENKNIAYDFRNGRGNQQALVKLTEDLVRQKPDLIVTSSTTATVPVAKLTRGSNLPVVFLSSGDPLRFVKSYASSGNNLTGISSSSLDLTGKRIELLKKLAPGMKRLILIIDSAGVNYAQSLRLTREESKKAGLELSILEINTKNIQEARQKIPLIKRTLGDGLLVPPEATVVAFTEDIAQQAIKEKIPQVGPNIETVKRGLLSAYSSNYYALGQQGAVLVDKILKGTKPSDLPIEQPQRLYMMINSKTAKAMGLNLPKEILLLAEEVIE